MSDKHLDPAKTVIGRIGIEKVAEITGKHVSRVYRWMYPKDRGGTGGLIPQKEQPALLGFARQNGIELNERDFFPATSGAMADIVSTSPPG